MPQAPQGIGHGGRECRLARRPRQLELNSRELNVKLSRWPGIIVTLTLTLREWEWELIEPVLVIIIRRGGDRRWGQLNVRNL
jgi:hypothetical protein